MSRSKAIECNIDALPTLDDDRLGDLVDLVGATVDDSVLPRTLTGRERALLEQSRQDFERGRTMTSAEARASIDEELAKLGVPKSAREPSFCRKLLVTSSMP